MAVLEKRKKVDAPFSESEKIQLMNQFVDLWLNLRDVAHHKRGANPDFLLTLSDQVIALKKEYEMVVIHNQVSTKMFNKLRNKEYQKLLKLKREDEQCGCLFKIRYEKIKDKYYAVLKKNQRVMKS